MTEFSFWRQQSPDKPLFPDIEWGKPEQRAARGKLLIVGGSRLGFRAVGDAYKTALASGAGEVKVALPDTLKKILPPGAAEGIFLPTNHSGGFARDGLDQLLAAVDWSNGALLVGDSGQNSETAILFEALIDQADRPLTIARDAVDLLRPASEKVVSRPDTHLVVSFAQAQKLFSAVYYPKILTFSMQLAQLVDNLHKFTITYPVTITLFHQNHLVAAHSGEVVTMPFGTPARIWNGEIAARAATYLLWTPSQPLEAAATSWVI
jgi:NAD(P)H-hydrate repair Nnr-like enzyme with NAD(P)H-hydrate dehydratase domain